MYKVQTDVGHCTPSVCASTAGSSGRLRLFLFAVTICCALCTGWDFSFVCVALFVLYAPLQVFDSGFFSP